MLGDFERAAADRTGRSFLCRPRGNGTPLKRKTGRRRDSPDDDRRAAAYVTVTTENVAREVAGEIAGTDPTPHRPGIPHGAGFQRREVNSLITHAE